MIFLGLGSNLGDKVQNIHTALRKMEENTIEVLRVSTLHETPPWGNTNQPPFINAVAEVSHQGNPFQLLRTLLRIEREMGRIREEKWGPRIIDLDIIEYHRQVCNSVVLTLPHPLYRERDFVLIPLRELEPDWVATVVGKDF